MKSLVIIVFTLLLIEGGAAQSKLPARMPANITVTLSQGSGMKPYYKKIRIDGGVLEYEEVVGTAKVSQKWSKNVSREDLAKLYRTFVENKFDAIKNEERKEFFYDASSESISIAVNKTNSFRVTSGKNAPLSKQNLARYQTIRKAIYDLVAKYQDLPTDQSSNENRVPSEMEKYIQGAWRTAGQNGGVSWFLEWHFENGKFKQYGYPPITQTGKYKVVSAEDKSITLELYEQNGTFGTEKKVIQILIDKETNKLSISGAKDFARIESKKLD